MMETSMDSTSSSNTVHQVSSSSSNSNECVCGSQAPVWLGKNARFSRFPEFKSPKKSDFPEGEFQNFEWKYDILYWKMSNFLYCLLVVIHWMNLYSFMLINKDASRIYSTTLSSKQLLYVFVCDYLYIYTSIHSTTLQWKNWESIE